VVFRVLYIADAPYGLGLVVGLEAATDHSQIPSLASIVVPSVAPARLFLHLYYRVVDRLNFSASLTQPFNSQLLLSFDR
jgi:hypothetical protein